MIRPVCLALLASAAAAHALIIQIDYSLDTGNFFGNQAARDALEKAADDLEAAILPSLNAVVNDVFVGTNGSTTATLNWSLSLRNPTTNTTMTINTFSLAADTITIAVGARELGTTLGVGGPSGAGINIQASGFPNQWVGAMAAGESASNAVMPRGGGPVVGNLSGSASLGGTPASYSLDYGILSGSVSFDTTTNWYFGLSPSVPAGQNDFYSVALHEMLHVLGIGASDTWNDNRNGTNWLGPEVLALVSGNGLVNADHITDGTMSFRVSDGMAQEVVMDSNITVGTRKSLTQLDLAFLRDLGYATVPEPSTAALLGIALALAGTVRHRRSPG